MPLVVALPLVIDMMLVPNCVNSSTMKRRVPSPSEVSRMTEAMPITIPSTVRTERNRRAATAAPREPDRFPAARVFVIAAPAPTIGSSRAARRAGAAPNRRPTDERHEQGCADRPRRGLCREARVEPAQQSAPRRRRRPGRRGLPPSKAAPPRRGRRATTWRGRDAERLEQPDLARALRDRDEHHVHDPDARDRQRDGRDPDEAAVRRARIRPKVARTESCVSTVTSSSPSWRSCRTRRTPSCAAGISSCERTSIRSRKRRRLVEHLHGPADRHVDHLVDVHADRHSPRQRARR